MTNAPVCQRCGTPLAPDDHGRFVSCCAPMVPPRPPGPPHGGGSALKSLVERGAGLVGEHPAAARPIARLIVFVVLPTAVLIVLCTGLLW